jgi:hypothetical protein
LRFVDSEKYRDLTEINIQLMMKTWSTFIDTDFINYFEHARLVDTLKSLMKEDSKKNNILSKLDCVLHSGETDVKAFDVNILLGERIYKFDIYLLDIVDGKTKLFTIMYVKLDEKEY